MRSTPVREYIGDWRVWSGELLALLEACSIYLSKDGIGGIYFTEEKTQVPLYCISAFEAPSHHIASSSNLELPV
ncbi:unnamed protein product [Sphagnum balticum]